MAKGKTQHAAAAFDRCRLEFKRLKKGENSGTVRKKSGGKKPAPVVSCRLCRAETAILSGCAAGIQAFSPVAAGALPVFSKFLPEATRQVLPFGEVNRIVHDPVLVEAKTSTTPLFSARPILWRVSP